jgi:glycosyltransferase involved in cell wall biosynthesis
MKVSGFTITKNAVKYNYPLKESILSILPICDEFIINVGESDDGTLELVNSIQSSKIKVFSAKWDFSKGSEELANQTNFALSRCGGDWAFYLQNDEVIHEKDLKVLVKIMQNKLTNNIDAVRFRYFHFYNSFYRYRIDAGWYQKEDRIIKNNNTIKSTGDAKGFKRIDGKNLKRFLAPCFIYHYGWIQDENKMKERQSNASDIGFGYFGNKEKNEDYKFYNHKNLPIYFGKHPKVMEQKINNHKRSIEDFKGIKRKYFWNPFLWFRIRYKTFLRNKKALPK